MLDHHLSKRNINGKKVDYISFGNLNWQKFYLYSGYAKRRKVTESSVNTHFNKKGGGGGEQFLGTSVSPFQGEILFLYNLTRN